MALTFTPYPLPEPEPPRDRWAEAPRNIQSALQAYADYKLKDKAIRQQAEHTRQEREGGALKNIWENYDPNNPAASHALFKAQSGRDFTAEEKAALQGYTGTKIRDLQRKENAGVDPQEMLLLMGYMNNPTPEGQKAIQTYYANKQTVPPTPVPPGPASATPPVTAGIDGALAATPAAAAAPQPLTPGGKMSPQVLNAALRMTGMNATDRRFEQAQANLTARQQAAQQQADERKAAEMTVKNQAALNDLKETAFLSNKIFDDYDRLVQAGQAGNPLKAGATTLLASATGGGMGTADARAYDQAADALVGRFKRFTGNVGMLTEQDQARLRLLLPVRGDNPEVARRKRQSMNELIGYIQSNQLHGFNAALTRLGIKTTPTAFDNTHEQVSGANIPGGDDPSQYTDDELAQIAGGA